MRRNSSPGIGGGHGDQYEYRIAELADQAGVPVRTVRFYRERDLIPQPRREGRIAWYNSRHLARLRAITALLKRGHTLNGIADLTMAYESGLDIGDLLCEPTKEAIVRRSPREIADSSTDETQPDDAPDLAPLRHAANGARRD
ncbi:MerR family transcriptional regulator [Streptomyces sp. NPDC058683]|uniref:MerR family transcriptional regulator n=1 Tax=Streptomyces sp. NPDC058683 TaxID=3346597 RepID=UPI00364656C1